MPCQRRVAIFCASLMPMRFVKPTLARCSFTTSCRAYSERWADFLNFLKPLVAVFALGHRGRQLPCFSAFHGAHAFLCCSKNSIEELACIGEVGLQCTFLILSGFQAQLDDKGRCARFHSGLIYLKRKLCAWFGCVWAKIKNFRKPAFLPGPSPGLPAGNSVKGAGLADAPWFQPQAIARVVNWLKLKLGGEKARESK